jgi:hypothetical protein
MNWKTTINKLNKQQYSFPAGWDTREEIAEQLDCSVERVAELLAPGLRSGQIERGSFPVWDERTGRKVMVTGYRERIDGKAKSSVQAKPEPSRGRGRPKIDYTRPGPGTRVQSRKRGTFGTVQPDGGVLWDTGNTSYPGEGTFREDIRVVP